MPSLPSTGKGSGKVRKDLTRKSERKKLALRFT